MTEYERPRVLNGYSMILQSGCGKIHVTVNFDGARPVEVYVRGSGSGGCEANLASTGRLISKALQHGMPIAEVLKQLYSIKCAVAMKSEKTQFDIEELGPKGARQIKSCSDGVAKAIAIALRARGTIDDEGGD